jgi:hypothetical protein
MLKITIKVKDDFEVVDNVPFTGVVVSHKGVELVYQFGVFSY